MFDRLRGLGRGRGSGRWRGPPRGDKERGDRAGKGARWLGFGSFAFYSFVFYGSQDGILGLDFGLSGAFQDLSPSHSRACVRLDPFDSPSQWLRLLGTESQARYM